MASLVGKEATPMDPVCGMHVPPGAAAISAIHKGVTYHFCCAACKEEFATAPERFV